MPSGQRQVRKNASNAGLRSPKSVPWWTPASLRTLSENMLDLDDPAHRRLRPSSTRRSVVRASSSYETAPKCWLRSRRSDAREVEARPYRGFRASASVDRDLGAAGLPEEARTRFRKWTNVFLGARSEFRMALSLPSIFALMRYLRRLVATRRRSPKDDLISALIAVETVASG